MLSLFGKYLVLCVFLKSILICLSAEIRFMITLVSVLKSVDKANAFESVLKCVSVKSIFYLRKHLTTIYL